MRKYSVVFLLVVVVLGLDAADFHSEENGDHEETTANKSEVPHHTRFITVDFRV